MTRKSANMHCGKTPHADIYFDSLFHINYN